MTDLTGRREFILGAFYAGAAGVLLPRWGGHPAPRVTRLSRRRGLKGLGPLEAAFRFLETSGVESKEPGRYELEGERLYATVVRDKTRSPEGAQFESHRRYIDLHYLISGRELIGSERAEGLREAKAYSPETDAALYERPERYNRLILGPGDFVVFFPGQAHMPGCFPETSQEIKKVVVKVLAAAG